MSLETATYISDLNPANPTGGDPRSQLDDHLRLLKTVLQNTFPGGSAPIYGLRSGTATAATSGTTVDFTSIPSWVKRITVMLNAVSLTGTDSLLLQLGDSGGIEVTGYAATNASIANGSDATVSERTDGFALQSNAANGLFTGSVTLSLLNASTNTWVASGSVARGNGNTNVFVVAGSKSLTATLDSIRLTPSGSNNFDGSGVVNAMWE